MSFRESVESMREDLIALRHQLHRDPEIGLHLPRTQEKILRALDGLPLEISTGTGLSSVVAVLRGARSGPTVLLRGDMDALPVQELTGLPYASEVPGAMQACGHDMHMAFLIGAARLLAGARDDLAGNVIFMFQPGEESPGGAEPMIAEGLLEAAGERPIAAYAIHVIAANDKLGWFSTRRGPFMAACDTLRVNVNGVGGHGSTPHHAKDPIPAACEMVVAMETFVTRNIDIWDPVVVTTGSFHSGTADNVIPAAARFESTVRSFSADSRERIGAGLAQVVNGVAAAHGLSAEIEYERGYPVTVNSAAEAEFAASVALDLFGPERFGWIDNPGAGSEDFSYVLNEVPGCYLNVGACPAGTDPEGAPGNHSPYACYDDSVLPDAALLLAELAQRRLRKG